MLLPAGELGDSAEVQQFWEKAQKAAHAAGKFMSVAEDDYQSNFDPVKPNLATVLHSLLRTLVAFAKGYSSKKPQATARVLDFEAALETSGAGTGHEEASENILKHPDAENVKARDRDETGRLPGCFVLAALAPLARNRLSCCLSRLSRLSLGPRTRSLQDSAVLGFGSRA